MMKQAHLPQTSSRQPSKLLRIALRVAIVRDLHKELCRMAGGDAGLAMRLIDKELAVIVKDLAELDEFTEAHLRGKWN